MSLGCLHGYQHHKEVKTADVWSYHNVICINYKICEHVSLYVCMFNWWTCWLTYHWNTSKAKSNDKRFIIYRKCKKNVNTHDTNQYILYYNYNILLFLFVCRPLIELLNTRWNVFESIHPVLNLIDAWSNEKWQVAVFLFKTVDTHDISPTYNSANFCFILNTHNMLFSDQKTVIRRCLVTKRKS